MCWGGKYSTILEQQAAAFVIALSSLSAACRVTLGGRTRDKYVNCVAVHWRINVNIVWFRFLQLLVYCETTIFCIVSSSSIIPSTLRLAASIIYCVDPMGVPAQLKPPLLSIHLIPISSARFLASSGYSLPKPYMVLFVICASLSICSLSNLKPS